MVVETDVVNVRAGVVVVGVGVVVVETDVVVVSAGVVVVGVDELASWLLAVTWWLLVWCCRCRGRPLTPTQAPIIE